MQATKTIWQSGKLIPWADAKVHVLTHSLHYGSGAFEGIRFYQTKNGPAIFRLKDHIDRLFYSMKTLKMHMPYTKDEVANAIIHLVRENQIEEGYIRPLAFFGYGKLGVNPMHCPADLIIACWRWGSYLPHDSVDIKTSKYIRIHPDSTVIEAKLCGHYINSVLASLELRGTHYHEALFLDSDGYISEGVGENFFMVKDNIIFTPKLGTILSGITRNTIIQLAKKLGYEVVEDKFTLQDAYKADEAFFTGTAAEVTPIRSIDDVVLAKGPIGPVSLQIKSIYADAVRGKIDEFNRYLTLVKSVASVPAELYETVT